MANSIIVFLYNSFRVTRLLLGLLIYFITHPSEWFSQSHTPVTPVPACLIDPVYGKHVYIDLNGKRLHYIISGPDGAPLMLMLHGAMEFWYSWRYQIKEFSNNYRVVALDLPGYGYSEKTYDSIHYTPTQLSSDVVDLINALGYEKCILVGQSMGAIIGWNTVRFKPNLFTHFVVLAGPDPVAMGSSKLSTQTRSKFWYTYVFRMPRVPEFMLRCNNFKLVKAMYRGKWNGLTNQHNMSAEDFNAHLSMFKQDRALTPIFNYYRYFRIGSAGIRTDRITVPTLIIWAEKDRVLTKELAEQCTTSIEQFELNYLPCSHWVQQDMPREVNTLITNFLAFY